MKNELSHSLEEWVIGLVISILFWTVIVVGVYVALIVLAP